MLARSLLTLLALVFVGNNHCVASTTSTSNTVRYSTIAPRKSLLILDQQLAVRGGAGPIDAELFAKGLTGLFLVHGAFLTIAPEVAAKPYGFSAPSDMLKLLITAGGEKMLNAMIPLGMLLFGQTTSVTTALGGAYVVNIVIYLTYLLKIVQGDIKLIEFNIAVNSVAAYAGLSNQDWASIMFKVLATIHGVLGAFGLVAPRAYTASWRGAKETFSDIENLQMQNNLNWSILVAVVTFALLDGKDAVQTLAFVCGFGVLMILKSILITKDAEKLGLPRSPMYIWLVLNAAYTYTALDTALV
jgi:hypothetical protein